MLGVFEIHEPETAQDASTLLAKHGWEATVYAGGTELLVLMKEGLVHYPHLVNIKTVPGLDGITVDTANNSLEIGSLATHRQLETSETVKERLPLLAEVEATVANVRVRSAGTIGGNLCFAEPHSDPATFLMAWGATLELTRGDGSRQVAIEDFFVDLFETAREEDEILTGIKLPLLADTTGGYEKFTTHERPTACVATVLQMKDGAIDDARLSVGSVGPVPIRVPEAEGTLRGEQPSDALFEAAAEHAHDAADAVGDIYGSANYKRHLVRVLTARALNKAVAQAGRKG